MQASLIQIQAVQLQSSVPSWNVSKTNLCCVCLALEESGKRVERERQGSQNTFRANGRHGETVAYVEGRIREFLQQHPISN